MCPPQAAAPAAGHQQPVQLGGCCRGPEASSSSAAGMPQGCCRGWPAGRVQTQCLDPATVGYPAGVSTGKGPGHWQDSPAAGQASAGLLGGGIGRPARAHSRGRSTVTSCTTPASDITCTHAAMQSMGWGSREEGSVRQAGGLGRSHRGYLAIA
ncbi:hypothetical protein HaLaN_23343 [Haematococcus lacustris]|uniref:Uncharacterized protein n=1 Tax=Haematococcus lacustris TaxID=44745 RepID=A0A699ZRW9_HAELA|nr:hypothetical protein HaLaN_23343 [Haematococcus lacustris]